MPNNQYGVDATKTALVFLAKVASAVQESYADKKITLTDAANFFGVILDAPGAIKAFPYLKNELLDEITPEELKQLQDTIVSTGVIPESAKDAVVDGLALVVQTKSFIEKYFIKKA